MKKCFFETYRFSEDLDFSLTPDAAYDEISVRTLIAEVAEYCAEASGIGFPIDRIELRVRRDKLGRPTHQGKVAYQGPLLMPNWPRVLLDITQNETVVDVPVHRPIFHLYPDELPSGVAVTCYSIEELFAEKMRALLERTRPRDLYDVVHLWDRGRELSLDKVRTLLARKCAAKSIPLPSKTTMSSLVRGSAELQGEWSSMLEHQLPSLPALDIMLARLDEVLSCGPRTPAASRTVGTGPGHARRNDLRAPRWPLLGSRQRLELVRFAGANRLKVAFKYGDRPRLAEPYSLRRKETGNLLLYAWRTARRTSRRSTRPRSATFA